ncbi:class I SAM-dependent rRNA methyltransferase [Acidisphaera sp. L21]|uniref:class I SAM-dependent rRNA methyltransferase n=1 Tax=Acidisphaera sp. L21 TaxID=1641851 RepID=UPI00131A7C73|nr:class I SAM-dependent rRNA methyltransferase [Acidisphaera sp. L21]
MQHPLLRLSPKQDRRLKSGHPWAFSNELATTPEHRSWTPGGIVRLEGDDGWRFGTFMFNPHSLIAARLLDRDPAAEIGADWIQARLAAAVALRSKVAPGEHHRLVHAEADRLPGLIIDRFGDVAVVQANTAGMDRLLPEITAALLDLLPLRAIVARNDSASRVHEGLPQEVRLLHGEQADAVAEEGGVRFPIDPLGGQKTGFFYDQRVNRSLVASLAQGARVLDVFCHIGAFGLRAAAAGAASVTLVDSSQPALDHAMAAAATNDLQNVTALRGDAFDIMGSLAGQEFDIVVCDPPAFAKSKRDQDTGLRAYHRMARLAAPLVAPGGFLFVASCSHHAPLDMFSAQVASALSRAKRDARILHTGAAGPDHPVHPHLPESAYLKSLLFQLT